MPITHAQVDAWAIGDQAVVMPPGTNGPASAPFALPQPNNPGYDADLQYQGQVAQRSQHVRTTGDGRILFFAVDGNLYDGDGYLIADARPWGCEGEPDECCTECLEPGVMEFVSVPVPGSCNLFYLFSGVPRNDHFDGSHVQWSILDMDADNPRFPPQAPATGARQGRLLHFINDPGTPDYPQFAGVNYIPEYDQPVGVPFVITSEHVGRLSHGTYDPVAKSITPMIRLVEAAEPGQPHWLFYILNDRVYVYKVAHNGVFRVDPNPGHPLYSEYVPLTPLNTVVQPKRYIRDADAIRSEDPFRSDDPIVLALSSSAPMWVFPAPNEEHDVLVLRFNPFTGAYLPQESEGYGLYVASCPTGPDTGVIGGTRGCALRADGHGLFLTGETTTDCQNWTPFVIHIQLGSGAVTDLGYAFSGGLAPEWTRTRIYRNRAPDNSGWAIYFPAVNAVAALTGLSNLNAVTFAPAALTGVQPPEFTPIPGSFGNNEVKPRFLNIGVAGDSYLSAENRAECCTFLSTHGSGVVYGHQQIQGMAMAWNPATNPYGGATLTFVSDLVVAQGATLDVTNMEWRFAPNARIVVERGGRLLMNNSWATSNSCTGDRWPGIRVEGTTANGDQTSNAQGHLRISGGGVRNAVVGAWAAREQSNGLAHPAYFGGRVLAYSATFKDCITGARITNYHRDLVAGTEPGNLSRFSGSLFETTADWPAGVPNTHIYLADVAGIQVTSCAFVNEVPQDFGFNQRGWGIRALDASFSCKGSSNYSAFRFENLSGGVLAWLPDPSESYTVDGMGLHNNNLGIVDLGSSGARVTNNQFVTLGSDEPLTGFTSIGLLMMQSELYTVERNSFTDQGTNVPSAGIWFMGPAYEDNEIYDNEFTALNAGCVVQGRHTSFDGSPSLVPGLQLRCGDHLDNWVDQLIIENGYIRHNQGAGGGPQNYANNRFLSAVSCDPGTSPAYHPYVAAFQNYPFFTNYHFYGHAASPEQRPDCIEDENEVPLSFIGDWFYDLLYHAQQDAFDKEEHCKDGILDDEDDDGPGDPVELAGQYHAKLAELHSAWASYTGTVDKEKRLDLIAAINFQPWHPSHYLRDQLLLHHPLSDEVIKAAILRAEPMDPWHLTQVLIQNSRLSPWVWELLDQTEVLPTYFYDLLRQMQSGGSLRQIMEQEIVLRQQEKTRVQRRLLHLYATDTTLVDVPASVLAVLQADSLGDGVRGAYLLHLMQGDLAAAAALAPLLEQHEATEQLVTLGAMYDRAGADWEQLTQADRDDLLQMAYGHAPASGAHAWAVLLLLNEVDSVPMPELPGLFKSYMPRKAYRADALEPPPIGVLPNPASDRIAFTYADGLEDGVLEVFDAQGRLMRTIPLNGRRGLVESNVQGWSEGLYVVRLVLEGHNLGSTKFNVVR